MKKQSRKLPASKRRELEHAVSILRETFAATVSTRKAPRLRHGKILKIILFGSYARGDWVHDPVGRYFSDFDLLVVVDHEDLTDLEFWEAANDRLLAEISTGSQLRTPVTFIVHSLDDVNQKLDLGRYFFTDIVRDGVVLFSEPDIVFVQPLPLSPTAALNETEGYFQEWTETASQRFRMAELAVIEEFNKVAAFELHQAAEALYTGLLLVLTLYTPRSHNLVHLRKLTEPLVPHLTEVWPHDTKFQKRCFELLRAAYVKARYSRHYKITEEELAYLTERIALLRGIVREACEKRLAELRQANDAVAGEPSPKEVDEEQPRPPSSDT
ncbi:HEPN domain-containing protein [Brevundimonas naejangsanensis]|uniref:HEPN domain-containing protein n=1 Tax=Brevundimonas naejangsanensis TaxID=588932 RepID=UPI00106B3E96|nr:HEPN domain-containing protein [Brevundimonas naejangsanensis]QBQ47221.1 HEPN domain-containing protein [Brevundimonas naejangsanensis]